MRADFRSFLDDDDRETVIQLHHSAGGRETRGASPYDYHVEFH